MLNYIDRIITELKQTVHVQIVSSDQSLVDMVIYGVDNIGVVGVVTAMGSKSLVGMPWSAIVSITFKEASAIEYLAGPGIYTTGG